MRKRTLTSSPRDSRPPLRLSETMISDSIGIDTKTKSHRSRVEDHISAGMMRLGRSAESQARISLSENISSRRRHSDDMELISGIRLLKKRCRNSFEIMRSRKRSWTGICSPASRGISLGIRASWRVFRRRSIRCRITSPLHT